MLGIPLNGSFIETRSDYDARVNSHGAFVHDDWRVSDRLTLNLGVRYDLELGLSEVDNRNIGGFDLSTSNPIEAQARANFAANPPSGVPIPASAFNVPGGYTYLSGDQRSVWNADTNNFQPRAGSPTSCPRGRWYEGAPVCSSRHFRFMVCPGLRPV